MLRHRHEEYTRLEDDDGIYIYIYDNCLQSGGVRCDARSLATRYSQLPSQRCLNLHSTIPFGTHPRLRPHHYPIRSMHTQGCPHQQTIMLPSHQRSTQNTQQVQDGYISKPFLSSPAQRRPPGHWDGTVLQQLSTAGHRRWQVNGWFAGVDPPLGNGSKGSQRGLGREISSLNFVINKSRFNQDGFPPSPWEDLAPFAFVARFCCLVLPCEAHLVLRCHHDHHRLDRWDSSFCPLQPNHAATEA
jgi:hypothetical protein